MKLPIRPLLAQLGLGLFMATISLSATKAQILVPESETYPSTGASFGGTGTGNESGFGTGSTGTGVESGLGLGSTGTGMESNSAGLFQGTPAFMRPIPGETIGEGMPEDLRSPDDPSLIPYDFIGPPKFHGPPRPGDRGAPELSQDQVKLLSDQLFENAQRLTNTEVKVRALDRLARSEIFGTRLLNAIRAIDAANVAVRQLPDGTIKNIRLVSLSTTSTNLTDALIREAIEPDTENRREWVDRAIATWKLAADFSSLITNNDLRSEMVSRVAFDISEDAQLIAAKISEFELTNDLDKELRKRYEDNLDELFDLAIEINEQVPMNVWRNEVAQKIAIKGALAYRFERALKAARTIKQNAPRALALARVAEALARFDLNDQATEIFNETADVASRISEVSVRNVVAGDLVDRLIALGRFRDARMAIYLYEDDDLRLKALGAVAENQARRGLAHHAVDWINAEIQPVHRSTLIKRVQDGVLQSIQSNVANSGDVMMYEQPSR
ncbi:MAG: hypothetical protein RJA81_528 [Planctomycetota bacterium]